jgi:hypothetical protein
MMPNYLDKVKAYWTPPAGFTETKQVDALDEHRRKFTKEISVVRTTPEMHVMQYVDFISAQKRFPKEWSLEPPKDAEVIDKSPIDLSADAGDEQLNATPPASPPIVKRGAVKNPI